MNQNSVVQPTSPAAPIQPGQILHIHETSTYVGLSRAKVYELIKAGTFAPMVRLSARRVGFRLRDLDSWLDARVAA